MDTIPYSEILSQIERKDKAGLELLYTTYGRKFYMVAVKKWFLNEDDAWNIVYQTLETLVLRLPGYSFDSQLHFENFLFKVFTNYLRQHYRRHRKDRLNEVNIGVEFHTAAEDNGSGEDAEIEAVLGLDSQAFQSYYLLDSAENPKLQALRCALEKLEEQERDILLLRAQNYSYDEIAAMLNIPNDHLKVKHHRSKQKLIKLLNAKTTKNA